MAVDSGEYKSKVGLDKLYYAKVTTDDSTTFTPGTITYLAPAAEASLEPTTSLETQYADDQPYDVAYAEGDTKITLKVTNIDLAALADITGNTFDTTSGRMFDIGGTPPYCSLSFRSKKSNGSYRYYQYLKGKFSMPKEEMATLGEKPEPKLLELNFTAVKTTYKFRVANDTDASVKLVRGDDDTTGFSGTTWFDAVQVPSYTS